VGNNGVALYLSTSICQRVVSERLNSSALSLQPLHRRLNNPGCLRQRVTKPQPMHESCRGQARADKIMLRASPRLCQLPDGGTKREEISMSCSVISALLLISVIYLQLVSWFFAMKDMHGRPGRLQPGLLPSSSRLVQSLQLL
jgi:hypothetical protein